jgi:hypothetical protein
MPFATASCAGFESDDRDTSQVSSYGPHTGTLPINHYHQKAHKRTAKAIGNEVIRPYSDSTNRQKLPTQQWPQLRK